MATAEKNTPEAARGNRTPVAADRSAPEQVPNRDRLRAHPAKVGAPFLLPTRDSPDTRQVKGLVTGRRGGTDSQPHTPDRLSERSERDAVAVAVPLDTTAQLRHCPAQPPAQPPQDAGAVLQKRAKAKGISQALADGLAGLGERTPLRYAYLASVACSAQLRQEDGKVRGKYCNARWCVVCNRIRTAKLTQAYGPQLASWDAPYFVTLTLPNCTPKALHGVVRGMIADIRVIAQDIRRTDKLKWMAVRKLEVSFNRERQDFHPHYHLVVNGKDASDAAVRRWLSLHPEASPAAQDIRPATDPAELFKYVTKLVTKGLDGKRCSTPLWALDVTFKALKGLRTIQPMGFKVSPAAEAVSDADGTLELDASTPAPIAKREPTEWHWMGGAIQDWVDLTTGEVLSGYTASPAHLRLLAMIRDAADAELGDGGGG